MSLGFYLLDRDSDQPITDQAGRLQFPKDQKLGTRAGAGWWCARCKISFCKGGATAVHDLDAQWFDECPACQAKPPKNGDSTPVKWAESFTWALPTGTVIQESTGGLVAKLAAAVLEAKQVGSDFKPIIDESGHVYSIEDFFALVAMCEIRFNEPSRPS